MTLLTNWKHGTYRMLAAVIGSVALTTAVHATVLNVPGTYPTIQAAVNAANPLGGDIIVVAAGSYTENVSINKPLTMQGAQAGVDARGRVASESIVIPAVGTSPQFLVAFNGTIIIDGFQFSGGPTGASGSIFTSVGPNNNMQIINNRFIGHPAAAVWMNRGGSDITLDKNVMDGSSISGSGQAIFCNGPQSYVGLYVTNNWIINNTGRYGLFVDGNHNVGESATRAPSISGNLFNNNLQGMNLGSRSFGTLGAPVTGPYGGYINNNTFSNHTANGFQGGCQHVQVSGNTFSGNAISGLVLTSFGNTGADRGAQNCSVTNNQFLNNGVGAGEGIFCSASQGVGLISTNHFSGNTISGNFRGATYTGSEVIDMENNWWGNNTGPTDPTGTNPTSGCTSGPAYVGDLVNAGGTGDSATSNGLDYCPFTVLPTLSINPTTTCYTADPVTVRIRMTSQNSLVVGGQFFLQYDNTRLSFVSASPGSPPFTEEVYESVNTGAGTIDYAVGVLAPNPGTMADTDMVVLTFNRIGDTCSTANLVTFRAHTPPTRLTNMFGDPLSQLLNNLPAITIDTTPPTIVCPRNIVANADAGGCTYTLNLGSPVVPSLYGDAAIVSGGVGHGNVMQTTSSASPFLYGGAEYDLPAPVLFMNFTHLIADYNRTSGCFGCGSGRFSLWVDWDNDNQFSAGDRLVPVYWGTPPNFTDCARNNVWQSTGEMIGTTDTRYGLQPVGGPFLGNYALAISYFGAKNILAVMVDDDNGCGPSSDHTMLTDNWRINNSVITFDNTPTATDSCTASPVVTGVRSDAQPLNAPYPTGTTTITWTATDGCGNQSTCPQTVTVTGMNAIDATVELAGVWKTSSPGSLSISRCIRFEVYKCGNAPVVVDQVVNFYSPAQGVSASGSTTLLVPCTGGTYTCITARDRLHTLRRTASAADSNFGISGPVYVADFTTAGIDDSLIGGNLNDDDFIDILDFGVFVGQYLANYGSGDTACSTPFPHADISGDGIVFAEDYTFIQINFLRAREANCCGLPTVSAPGGGLGALGDGGPVTRISVKELSRRGMQDLVVADLNHDGWLDDKDIAVFLNGGH